MTFWPRAHRSRRLLAESCCRTSSRCSPFVVITKHRYSAFYGTDLEIILRGLGVTTVVIAGVTTENCCHATARDAFFRDFQVVFLADATATSGYPDLGYGSMTAAEVHRAVLVVLARDTADVISTDTFVDRVTARD